MPLSKKKKSIKGKTKSISKPISIPVVNILSEKKIFINICILTET